MGVKVRFWKGAWWVFVNASGRRKAKRIGDRETALRVARALREKLACGELGLARASDEQSLKMFAETWLNSVSVSLKSSTVTFYKGTLERYVLPTLGTRQVASISRRDCRELIVACRGQKLSISTVRGIARTLSALLSQAVEDELLPANPALRLGRYLRKGDEPESQPDPFTRNEAELMLEVAKEHFPEWYAFILCGFRTGMRAGELLALQWGDVDWRGRFIRVERNIVQGKLTTPKNHQQRRVDMSPHLRTTLRLWRRHQRRRLAEEREPETRMAVCVSRRYAAGPLERLEGVRARTRQI
jgi:integrase